MTDNEIIKALECCFSDGDCTGCPFQFNTYECGNFNAQEEALNLINRQKAEIRSNDEAITYLGGKVGALLVCIDKKEQEIERLTNIVDDGAEVCHNCHSKYAEKIKQVKAEAFKEFLSALQERDSTMDKRIVSMDTIYDLVREKVGEDW